jgi:hypothetical protein
MQIENGMTLLMSVEDLTRKVDLRKALLMSPLPKGNCAECDSMWRDYGIATAEHLKLLLERDMAAARQDWELEDRLDSQIPGAERRRNQTRELIRKHESDGHLSR